MTKNETDIVQTLQEPYRIKDTLFDGLYTKTTHFLLAGLGINPNSNIFKDKFVNAYIDDAGIEHVIKNPVFMLLKTKEFDDYWKKLELTLKALPRFVYEYDVGMDGDNHLVMFAFEFPAIFATDYFKFLSGEYYKFSNPYKHLFKKDIINDKGTVVENAIYGVIHKTPSIKKVIETIVGEPIESEGEFWDKMSPEREIYRYNV